MHLGYLNNLKSHIKEFYIWKCASIHVWYRTAFSDHEHFSSYFHFFVYFLYVISNNHQVCQRYCVLNIIWKGLDHFVFLSLSEEIKMFSKIVLDLLHKNLEKQYFTQKEPKAQNLKRKVHWFEHLPSKRYCLKSPAYHTELGWHLINNLSESLL